MKMPHVDREQETVRSTMVIIGLIKGQGTALVPWPALLGEVLGGSSTRTSYMNFSSCAARTVLEYPCTGACKAIPMGFF